MDMVGRLQESKGIELTGIRTMAGLRRRLSHHNQATDLPLRFAWIVEDNSDHWTFYEKRIPFIMPFTGFHDDYHRPSDDVDKLNYDGIQRIARWMYGISRELADDPNLPRFRVDALQENATVQSQREAALPPSEPRLALQLAPPDNGPGRVVAQVFPQTAVAVVGLQTGDRIIQFGSHNVTPETNLAGLILRSASPVKIRFQRNGVEKPMRVLVPLTGKPIRIGINWRDDPAEPGVVAINLLEAGSPAEVAGLKLNDRILQVNEQDFADSDDCRKRLLSAPSPISLLIERDGRCKVVSLELPEDPPAAE